MQLFSKRMNYLRNDLITLTEDANVTIRRVVDWLNFFFIFVTFFVTSSKRFVTDFRISSKCWFFSKLTKKREITSNNEHLYLSSIRSHQDNMWNTKEMIRYLYLSHEFFIYHFTDWRFNAVRNKKSWLRARWGH
jgi:hypothetical protein